VCIWYHLPWHVVIEKGTVIKRLNGIDWLFALPDYDLQPWSRFFGRPYMDMVAVKTQRIGPKALKVPRPPILWRKNNVFLSIGGSIQAPHAIRDVDERNGIIYLRNQYDDNEEILVTYTYRESGYIYRNMNFNPTEFHNPAVLERFVVIYLLPYAGSGGKLRQLTVNHSESSTLLGALLSIPRTNEPVLVLGAAQVRQTNIVDDVEITDTRTRGGGVKSTRFENAKKYNEEAWSTTDRGFYDGLPYPGAAVVVTLDRALKDTFYEAEIRGLIKKHMAMGVYPIIEYS